MGWPPVAHHKPSFIRNARETLTLLALLLASASFLPAAHGAESAYIDELRRHATSAEILEREFRSAIQRAPPADRFDLYRTCDQLIGTWLQIESLETQLAAQPDEPTANGRLLGEGGEVVRWPDVAESDLQAFQLVMNVQQILEVQVNARL